MASADRPGAGGECPWMRMSPGIGLRPTPPPLFRTKGHSPPPSDLRGGRGEKDGNPTLQESGFPASLRSGVPERTADIRDQITEAAIHEGGSRATLAPTALRQLTAPPARSDARTQPPGPHDDPRGHL